MWGERLDNTLAVAKLQEVCPAAREVEESHFLQEVSMEVRELAKRSR